MEELTEIDGAAFQSAVAKELSIRATSFAAGVDKFRTVPRAASRAELPTVWTEGTTRVLHAEAEGRPVILVPSLINRAYILDLSEERSLLRHLAGCGIDAYLVDWQAPGETELSFDISDYIDRLARIRDHVTEATGEVPAVLGYCMGGLLALALAHRSPGAISKLALLATPWDFAPFSPSAVNFLASSMPVVEQTIRTFGVLPVDVLQAMFISLDPGGAAKKFRRFADWDLTSENTKRFIALEDWINDGVPLVPNVALQCLKRWYIENAPAQGRWRDRGRLVDPAAVTTETLVMVPEGDRIVPPASALPLAELCCNATKISVKAGHVGMIAGAEAVNQVYRPLALYFASAK